MLNKSKKIKHISLGIFACTILSLASIGFSTWIISLGDGNNSLNLSINIDVSYDYSKVIDYTPSQPIPTLNVENKSSVTLAGTSDIVISSYVYNSVFNSSSSNSLSIQSSIFIGDSNEEPAEDDSNNKNKVIASSSDAEQLIGRESNKEYEYFAITQPTIALPKEKFTALGTSFYKIEDFPMSQFGIQPGSFFKGDDPKTFYENQVEHYKKAYVSARENNENTETARENNEDTETDTQTALNNYLSVLELYGNDIDTMNQKLNGKEITITLTLVSEGGSN